MKVYAEYHYSAALLTDEDGKTMLVQLDQDQECMLGKDWEEGEYEIDDEYAEYFK